MQIASTRLAAINNHRFPGQYYDAETGLHQNYFRDYEASIGRYVQRDPIGLDGGINVFGYVGGGPLYWADPEGLVGQICVLNPAGCAQAADKVIRLCVTAIKAIAAALTAGKAVEIIDCEDCSSDEDKEKGCRSLKDSIMNTCYGLTGRKRIACFEAANIAYRQCMGYE
jgi:RHS repeat-associated protein